MCIAVIRNSCIWLTYLFVDDVCVYNMHSMLSYRSRISWSLIIFLVLPRKVAHLTESYHLMIHFPTLVTHSLILVSQYCKLVQTVVSVQGNEAFLI